jgi:small subunit ribosomal protein S10
MNQKYYLKLESYDSNMIKTTVSLWKKSAALFGIILKGPIFMPLKKSKIIVIRSPHIDKKSREAFDFVNYKALIILEKDLTKPLPKKDLYGFLSVCVKYLIPGISFKIIKII